VNDRTSPLQHLFIVSFSLIGVIVLQPSTASLFKMTPLQAIIVLLLMLVCAIAVYLSKWPWSVEFNTDWPSPRRIARLATLALIAGGIGWSLAIWQLSRTDVVPWLFADFYLRQGFQTTALGFLFALVDSIWTLRESVQGRGGEDHA